jgi:hypothetical protein
MVRESRLRRSSLATSDPKEEAEFFKAVSIGNPEALDAQQYEVVLQPKESRGVYFVPLKAARYELTRADHEWAGMVGEITIEYIRPTRRSVLGKHPLYLIQIAGAGQRQHEQDA